MSLKDKTESLANKMNKLTEKFNLAEEMVLSGDDILDFVEEKTQDNNLYRIPSENIVNLDLMVEDFRYIRETLKETTENGRRVLNSVTLDLLDCDGDKRASLITSFAELNTAVGNNMKLYMQSYKDISVTLLNIDRIKNKPSEEIRSLDSGETIDTVELLKRLNSEKSDV